MTQACDDCAADDKRIESNRKGVGGRQFHMTYIDLYESGAINIQIIYNVILNYCQVFRDL
jgi:hypothetical protein